jgi:ribosomal protein L11 methyltransferase
LPLYRIDIALPAGLDILQAGSFCDMLREGALSAACHGSELTNAWRLELLFDHAPDMTQLALRLALAEKAAGLKLPPQTPAAQEVAARNWLAESYRGFPAFAVGPFFIHGSHEKGPFPEDKIVLRIDAATAFGSGEHGTTKGCLLALARLAEQGMTPARILDLGTGSGILAIAAAKLWPQAAVLASDNDAEAVRVARHHAETNGAAHIKALAAEGLAAEELRGCFDLLIANILAGPLVEMAAEISARGEKIVLSGILNEQADNVIAAYAAQGAALETRDTIGDWTTLTLRGKSA